MDAPTQDVDDKTRHIIEAAVRAFAPDQRFSRIEIRHYMGRDVVEGFEIELYYERSNRRLGPKERAGMRSAIGDALAKHGDLRFTYLDHCFHADTPEEALTSAL